LINTKVLGSPKWLSDRMMDFASILHDSPPAVEGCPVIMPGEIELNKMAQQQLAGITLDPAVVQLLQEHAAKVA
jgi:LDH2 family malate/lactate/ureidoglycolate dehydrogenase